MSKERSRIIGLILFVCLMAFMAAACGGNGQENTGKRTRTITDCIGRQVKVPENPQKIAALDSFAGQVVIMLGCGDRLVATVGGVQRDKLLQAMSSGLENVSVAMSGGVVNMEELLRLGVDLLLIKGDIYNNQAEREKIERFQIPYVVVDYNSMKKQMQAFEIIGDALNNRQEADKFNAYYKKTIAKVKERVANLGEEEVVRLYHSVNEAVRTDIADSLPADWIAVTGAVNVSVGEKLTISEKNYYASLEQIFSWDPDMIICNESGVAGYIKSNSKWAGLRAVREDRVYQMPIGISRWGHPGGAETPLAILWLAQLLYPSRFEDIDLRTEIEWFYQTFYDYILDEETAVAILAGEGIRIPSTNAEGR